MDNMTKNELIFKAGQKRWELDAEAIAIKKAARKCEALKNKALDNDDYKRASEYTHTLLNYYNKIIDIENEINHIKNYIVNMSLSK